MNSFLDLTEDLLSETPLIDMADLWQLLFRFVFNFIVVGIIIHFFYYPKSKRRDYYFTFTLISISVFFLIFLLGSVKLKIGFALGIFAIFGIIRYRTESVPIREMTYLFTITALSVINALSIPKWPHRDARDKRHLPARDLPVGKREMAETHE